MNLSDFCKTVNNYFEKSVHYGTYTISGGKIVKDVDFLQSGQYYRIVNSVFNDGIYKYGEETLADETFTGEIWAMAVPPAVIELVDEINQWVDKYGEVANSPFNSESFGGYSYSKGYPGTGNSGGSGSDWTDIFAKKLNRWRKL